MAQARWRSSGPLFSRMIVWYARSLASVCIRVYLEAGDGLGLRAPYVERHGRNGEVWRRAGKDRPTAGVMGDRVVMQWWVVAVSRRSRAVPSSADVVDHGVVLRCGDTGDVGWLWRSFFFL